MMFLTRDEIKALTGRQQRAKQKEVLEAMGIQYLENGIDELVISRSHVERKLGGTEEAATETAGPKFSALDPAV